MLKENTFKLFHLINDYTEDIPEKVLLIEP